jgi:hypothetical protein
MAILGCTKLSPEWKKITHQQFKLSSYYLFNKNNTKADEKGKDDKEGKVNTICLVTDFVSDTEQPPESDDGDVHEVVTSGLLKENRARHDD